MGRFSPTVMPYSDGGFLGNLTRALTSGVDAYQGAQDRTEMRTERAEERTARKEREARQRLQWEMDDADRGVYTETPGVSNRPVFDERPIGPPTGDEVAPAASAAPAAPRGPYTIGPSEDVMAAALAASAIPTEELNAPQSPNKHVASFDPRTGKFPKSRPPATTLSNGQKYDPNWKMYARLEEMLAEQSLREEAERRRYGEEVGRRAEMLGSLAGTPGFEDVDPRMLQAASMDETIARALIEQGMGGREPSRGTPEYEAMLRREAAARRAPADTTRYEERPEGGGVAIYKDGQFDRWKVPPIRTAPTRAQLPTEAERKAAGLLRTGELGFNTLEKLLSKNKPAPGFVERQASRLGMDVGNVLSPDELRQMDQAAYDLQEAWLRLTSGAAIGADEIRNSAKALIPQPGDDPVTLRQKAAARAARIEALRQAAGRALNPAAVGTQPSGDEDLLSRIDAVLNGGNP